jgi:Zn-dependent alcohol dehydrogenase
MTMQAIVWTGELEVRDDVELRGVEPGEVRVRLHSAGLCHSDVAVVDGTIPFPTPVVLGHEGAGIVEEVGSATSKVKVGDHVVLTTLGNCGQCDACDRGQPTHCRDTMGRLGKPFRVGGEEAYQFANAGVFAQSTVVREAQAIVIDPRVPFDAACLIGCAVVTGAGAVLNRARVQPGQSVVVIGAGGIGLSVVQAARLAGASRIVVVDANPAKLDAAMEFGATDFIDASSAPDTVRAVRDLGLKRGVDHSFECVGHPALIRNAIDLLDWGGTCTLVGVPKLGTEASFVVNSLYNNKSILGCRYGAARPHHDIPLIVQLYLDGRFKLDEMVTKTYPLSGISEAISDLHDGKLNRGVLRIA